MSTMTVVHEYTTIDRSKWPSGEWDGEPDKVQWKHEATGLPCLAVRHPRSGHWCGYVGVAEGHPLFGKEYDSEEVNIYTHWGLTFADACSPSETESTGICHIPQPGEPDHVWWFGFDCAHHGDYSPQDAVYARDRGYPFTIGGDSTYKTLEFVNQECQKLADQLHAVRS